jgi:hypothetical protein
MAFQVLGALFSPISLVTRAFLLSTTPLLMREPWHQRAHPKPVRSALRSTLERFRPTTQEQALEVRRAIPRPAQVVRLVLQVVQRLEVLLVMQVPQAQQALPKVAHPAVPPSIPTFGSCPMARHSACPTPQATMRARPASSPTK